MKVAHGNTVATRKDGRDSMASERFTNAELGEQMETEHVFNCCCELVRQVERGRVRSGPP